MCNKRHRSYYRALKRGESWALELAKLSPLVRCLKWMYGGIDLVPLIYGENPLLSLISKQSCWTGTYTLLPMYFPKPPRKKALHRKNKRLTFVPV